MSELRKYMIAVGSLSVPPNPGRLLYSSPPVGNAAALTAGTLMFLLGALNGQMLVPMDFPVAKSLASDWMTVLVPGKAKDARSVCVVVLLLAAAKSVAMSVDMNVVSVVTKVSVDTEASLVSI